MRSKTNRRAIDDGLVSSVSPLVTAKGETEEGSRFAPDRLTNEMESFPCISIFAAETEKKKEKENLENVS